MWCPEIDRELLPMKMHYFFGFGALAPVFPFLTSISKQRGYSAFAIGLALTILPVPTFCVRLLVGAVTDAYECRKLAIFISQLLMIFAVIGLIFLPGSVHERFTDDIAIKTPLFWLFFSVVALLMISNVIRSVMEDTICVNLLGKNRHNKYGHQRLWGAVGVGTISFFSGAFVDWFSDDEHSKDQTSGYLVSIFCVLLDIYVVTKIKVVQNIHESVVDDLKHVICSLRVFVFLLTVVCFGFFISFIWNFEFWYLEDLAQVYHPETRKWIKTVEGLSQSIQCYMGEVPAFIFSSVIIKYMGDMNVFTFAFVSYALQFYLYSVITHPLWVLTIEPLNGITFALAYTVAVSHASDLAPVSAEGTIQGFVATAYVGIGLREFIVFQSGNTTVVQEERRWNIQNTKTLIDLYKHYRDKDGSFKIKFETDVGIHF